MSLTYNAWAEQYEAFEAETAELTWRDGIVAELKRLGCKDSHILDLGAGTGIGRRVLLELFPDCEVTCLDQSVPMLEKGDIPTASRVVADMAGFTMPPASFDFVVSGFDALNCLNAYQLAGCFRSVASALKPDGKMIFDYSSRRLLKYDWRATQATRHSALYWLKVTTSYDGVLDRTRVELEGGTEEATLWTETHFHYSLDPFLIDEIASANRLAVVKVRDIDREEFIPSGNTHVYVLARAPD